jgi:hypothetical protein
VLYQVTEGRQQSIWLLDLTGVASPTQVVADVRYPDFDHQGDLFTYSVQTGRETYAVRVVSYAAGDTTFEITSDGELTPGRDPQFSPDGTSIIYHYKPTGAETRTAIYDLGSGNFTDFSMANDGCAHASFSTRGTTAYCTLAGSVWARNSEGTADWTPLALFLESKDPSAYGPPLRGARFISYGFPETCGKDEWILLQAGGQTPGEDMQYAILIHDTQSDTILDLHGALESAFGAGDTGTYTGSCSP